MESPYLLTSPNTTTSNSNNCRLLSRPISTLPLELIHHILFLVRISHSHPRPISSFLPLSTVCYQWSFIVQELALTTIEISSSEDDLKYWTEILGSSQWNPATRKGEAVRTLSIKPHNRDNENGFTQRPDLPFEMTGKWNQTMKLLKILPNLQKLDLALDMSCHFYHRGMDGIDTFPVMEQLRELRLIVWDEKTQVSSEVDWVLEEANQFGEQIFKMMKRMVNGTGSGGSGKLVKVDYCGPAPFSISTAVPTTALGMLSRLKHFGLLGMASKSWDTRLISQLFVPALDVDYFQSPLGLGLRSLCLHEDALVPDTDADDPGFFTGEAVQPPTNLLDRFANSLERLTIDITSEIPIPSLHRRITPPSPVASRSASALNLPGLVANGTAFPGIGIATQVELGSYPVLPSGIRLPHLKTLNVVSKHRREAFDVVPGLQGLLRHADGGIKEMRLENLDFNYGWDEAEDRIKRNDETEEDLGLHLQHLSFTSKSIQPKVLHNLFSSSCPSLQSVSLNGEAFAQIDVAEEMKKLFFGGVYTNARALRLESTGQCSSTWNSVFSPNKENRHLADGQTGATIPWCHLQTLAVEMPTKPDMSYALDWSLLPFNLERLAIITPIHSKPYQGLFSPSTWSARLYAAQIHSLANEIKIRRRRRERWFEVGSLIVIVSGSAEEMSEEVFDGYGFRYLKQACEDKLVDVPSIKVSFESRDDWNEVRWKGWRGKNMYGI